MLKDLFIKYKQLIVYVIFGVLTTLVNFIVFNLCEITIADINYLTSNFIAWCVAVTFAFFTNKLIVFESKSLAKKLFIFEFVTFVLARIFSLVIEQFGMYLFIDLFDFKNIQLTILFIIISGKNIAKIIMSIVTIILNYIFSKLIVFNQK